jgi:hypothetical protein
MAMRAQEVGILPMTIMVKRTGLVSHSQCWSVIHMPNVVMVRWSNPWLADHG